jgi:hypothetical protein
MDLAARTAQSEARADEDAAATPDAALGPDVESVSGHG